MPNLDAAALGAQIFNDVKDILKGEWDTFTPEQRTLVQVCSLDAARITLLHISGVDVASEKVHIDAQLANVKSATAGAASDVLWSVVGKVMKTLLGILIAL